MSKKRFWWSVAAVWVLMMASDWLFHGVWMQSWYQQTAQFWRPREEMQKMMWWMWFGQAIWSWAFVWIYSHGINKDNQWAQAFRYAIAILLVSKVPQNMEMWAVVPYPGELVARWLIFAIIQAVAAAFVMTWTFKPMEMWSGSTASR